jgi:hypothetical protein
MALEILKGSARFYVSTRVLDRARVLPEAAGQAPHVLQRRPGFLKGLRCVAVWGTSHGTETCPFVTITKPNRHVDLAPHRMGASSTPRYMVPDLNVRR